MKTVLFVCTENSFRSQIAEAYFNEHSPAGWTAISAGPKPAKEIHPNAALLMLEEGMEIGHKRPKLLTIELQEKAEIVIIVCSGNLCPVVHKKHVERWSIPDPARMPLDEARHVRDVIKKSSGPSRKTENRAVLVPSQII